MTHMRGKMLILSLTQPHKTALSLVNVEFPTHSIMLRCIYLVRGSKNGWFVSSQIVDETECKKNLARISFFKQWL